MNNLIIYKIKRKRREEVRSERKAKDRMSNQKSGDGAKRFGG